MNDPEIRDSLLELAQLLRSQAEYLRSFHHSSVALYKALEKNFPELEKSYRENLVAPLSIPQAEELIARIDRAIQKLRSAQLPTE